MTKPIHTMIRVLNEEISVDFYNKAFGLEVVHRRESSKFILVYLSSKESAFEIELTINKGRTKPYDLGDGYGHLAFVVEDLASEHARFISEGMNPREMIKFEPDGELLGEFFFVQDPDGYQIEVLKKSLRYK